MATLSMRWALAIAIAILFTACNRQTPVTEAPPSPTATAAAPTDGPAKVPAAADTVAVPGERVGLVTASTTRADLAKLYGETALQDKDVSVGEGFTEPGTVVQADTPQTFTLIWTDATRERPLRAIDFGTAWKIPENLGMQSSFADLKATLGAFQLYGFGWDYAGTVVLEGSKLDRYHGNLFLRVQPDKSAIAAHADAYQALLGDQVFDADNPNMATLAPHVSAMEVYLNPLGE